MEFFPAGREPYPQQAAMIETILAAFRAREHAIISAPTGTGKTLAELCAAASIATEGARVYVGSRTHTQIKQLLGAMKTVGYEGTVAVLSSRDQSCCNERFAKLSGTEKNEACRSAVEDKTCERHLVEVEYAGIEDIEDLVARSKEAEGCAFYAARAFAEKANIVFAPYNYLFDPAIRAALEIKLSDAVVIVDEAHNIEGILRDSVSFECKRDRLKGAAGWLRGLMHNELARLLDDLHGFKSKIPVWGSNFPWPWKVKEWRAAAERATRTKSGYANIVGQLVTALAAMADNGKDFIMFVSELDALHIACLSPAVAMQSVAAEARSVVLVSGTLTPFDAVAKEVGVQFKHRLETGHVVDMATQALVRYVPKWGTEVMDARFANASRPEYMAAVGRAVVSIAAATPHGMLFFTTSYPGLERLVEAWRGAGILDELRAAKPVFVEERGKEADLAAFRAAAATPAGAVFLAVYRGKLAEGVDFADADARAVVCHGSVPPAARPLTPRASIPFAPYKDVLVEQKQNYNRAQHGAYAGRDWYSRQALMAVNQALGRCIRHRGDFGAVILLDQAFQANKSGISKWAREVAVASAGGDALVEEMRAFFAKHA